MRIPIGGIGMVGTSGDAVTTEVQGTALERLPHIVPPYRRSAVTPARSAGLVNHVRGLGPHDHVCWAFDDRANFRSRACEFIADGLAQGLRVKYIGGGPEESLLADLNRLDDLMGSIGRGALQVSSLEAAYPPGSVLYPAERFSALTKAVADALTAGFNGLRVVAEVTSLVRTSEQLEAFAAQEHVSDRLMVTLPYSAMCALNRRELGADSAEALACLHPIATRGSTLFRMYTTDNGDLALAGELDASVSAQFTRALELVTARSAGAELMFDGTGLDFIDHRALFSLRDCAARCGATAVLRTSSSLPARLIEILGIDGIRAQMAPSSPEIAIDLSGTTLVDC
jgi:anti-anti-sigma regulatory factor